MGRSILSDQAKENFGKGPGELLPGTQEETPGAVGLITNPERQNKCPGRCKGMYMQEYGYHALKILFD